MLVSLRYKDYESIKNVTYMCVCVVGHKTQILTFLNKNLCSHNIWYKTTIDRWWSIPCLCLQAQKLNMAVWSPLKCFFYVHILSSLGQICLGNIETNLFISQLFSYPLKPQLHCGGFSYESRTLGTQSLQVNPQFPRKSEPWHLQAFMSVDPDLIKRSCKAQAHLLGFICRHIEPHTVF